MATRFYLPFSAESTPFVFSTSSEWEDQTALVRAVARTTTIGNAMATATFTDTNNANRDILYRQYQTYPLTPGQIITGAQAIKAQARCAEVAAGNNMFFTVGLRILNKAAIEQKVMLAPTRDATEAALTLTNRQFTATSTAGSYTTVAGDYLVIEIGMGGDPANSGGADHDSSIRLGDAAASDLLENDSTTTDLRPWVELTSTLTFAPYSATAAITTGGVDFAASAEFFQLIFTATAAFTTGNVEFSATGTAGVHPVGKITQPKFGIFSRRSTFTAKTLTPPTSYATADLLIPGIECSATATFGGLYSSSATVTTTGMTFSGSGLHAAAHSVTRITQPTFGIFGQRYGSFAGKGSIVGTAALTIGNVEFTASATFLEAGVLPHPVGKITQPTFGIFGQRYGSFAFKGGLFEATAALTIGNVEFTATATAADPVDTATAALTIGNVEFAATATFATVTRTATSALTTGNVEFSATGTFISGTKTATTALTLGNVELSATATFVALPPSGVGLGYSLPNRLRLQYTCTAGVDIEP
jgi:hypothetical protein